MIDDISIKFATKTNHKINIMKRFLIVVMLIMGLQLCYDNMAKADDLDPTSELITGFLKKEVDPELPNYPHKPSRSQFYFTYDGNEVVVYSTVETVAEVRLVDAVSGEVIADETAELSCGHIINVGSYSTISFKVSVITESGIYSATF